MLLSNGEKRKPSVDGNNKKNIITFKNEGKAKRKWKNRQRKEEKVIGLIRIEI